MRGVSGPSYFMAIVIALHIFIPTNSRSAKAFSPSSNAKTIRTQDPLKSGTENSPFFFADSIEEKKTDLEIILFGIGDLRVSDHGGLHSALTSLQNSIVSENKNTKILPLLILSSEDTIANLPGLSSYTMNMATMVTTAVSSLSHELKSQFNLDLEVRSGKNMKETLSQLLTSIEEDEMSELNSINVHVCDLGEADNQIGYGPYAQIKDLGTSPEDKVDIQPWTCHLRESPWNKLRDIGNDIEEESSFPDTFPEFSKMYCESHDSSLAVSTPLPSISSSNDAQFQWKDSVTNLPTHQNVLSLFEESMKYSSTTFPDAQQIAQSKNTGLYGTHWGGVQDSICTEADTLSCLKEYTQVSGYDDNEFLSSEFYKNNVVKNDASLEHSSISWMSSSQDGSNDINGDNLIKGEMMIRYLAAPLFLGCVSRRQIYDASKNAAITDTMFSGIKKSILGEKKSVLEQFIENKEWQDLFAAKNILKENKQSKNLDGNPFSAPGSLQFRYWRWHGFLCRYAVSQLLPQKSDAIAKSIVLVHGFGASSAQWSRAVASLAAQGASKEPLDLAFAPDLIGFGQSEKPPLSYTQYLWESYVASFLKEVPLHKYKTQNFILGGNSIGGYTAMGCAADDTIIDREGKVSASGAPGTGRCSGLVLLNSAGRIFSEKEIQKESEKAAKSGSELMSMAQVTSGNLLGPCSPPPRDIATVGGNALLAYLRPRIESITEPLYPSNPSNVDKNLCGNIRRDSLDPGAINVMISGSKLPPPRTANELLSADFGAASTDRAIIEGQWKGPVLVTQGMKDPLNDSPGRAKTFGELRDGVEVWPLMEAGHCPHDERPDDVVEGILQWIDKREGDASLKSVGAGIEGELKG